MNWSEQAGAAQEDQEEKGGEYGDINKLGDANCSLSGKNGHIASQWWKAKAKGKGNGKGKGDEENCYGQR